MCLQIAGARVAGIYNYSSDLTKQDDLRDLLDNTTGSLGRTYC